MHETSLMCEIIQAAQDTARDHAIKKVTSIELIIGDQLSVLPEALSFAFECLKQETILKDSTMKWEVSPGREFYLAYIEGE